MDETQQSVLRLATQALRFATNHPYAATAIVGMAVGAAAGSSLTYRAITQVEGPEVVKPELYQLTLSADDLQALQDNPTTKLRWELPRTTIVVTAEELRKLERSDDISSDS